MTKAADVYGFAMIMWEMVTGEKLFAGMRQSQVCFYTQNCLSTVPGSF